MIFKNGNLEIGNNMKLVLDIIPIFQKFENKQKRSAKVSIENSNKIMFSKEMGKNFQMNYLEIKGKY